MRKLNTIFITSCVILFWVLLFITVVHAQTTSVTSEVSTQKALSPAVSPSVVTTVPVTTVTTETIPTSLVQNYAKFVNIGSLCGQIDLVEPGKINDAGQVVGHARACDGESIHAFLWTKGKMKDLGALHKEDVSVAVDINKKGQIVGYSESEENGSKMFSHQNGRMKKFKTDLYKAHAINDAGVIVGEYFDGTGTGEKNGFILTKDKVKTYSYAFFDINNSGQAIGVDRNNFGPGHAVLWQNGKATKLGVLPGDFMSAPKAINNNGVVVGYSSNYPIGHTFLWKNGVMSQINIKRSSFGFDINDYEQIVAGPFLYHNGETINLNDLLPPDSEWEIYDARSINNNGQIVGRAWKKGNYGWRGIGFLLDLPDEYKF